MSSFFMLYALTISVELVLSLVMLIFLYLIVAPVGSPVRDEAAPMAAVPPAETVEQALADAFATVSQGRDDLVAITTARAMLVRFARPADAAGGD